MTRQFVQGDVMLIEIKHKPRGKKVAPRADGRLVLARGEKSGHDHTVDSGAATLLDGKQGMALIVHKPVLLEHQQHPALELSRGYFSVVRQRRYVPLKKEEIYMD